MSSVSVRRSACDQCRAKRVRCLRPPSNTTPCARCQHLGAQCITSASGRPGRPRKRRFAGDDDSFATLSRFLPSDLTQHEPASLQFAVGELTVCQTTRPDAENDSEDRNRAGDVGFDCMTALSTPTDTFISGDWTGLQLSPQDFPAMGFFAAHQTPRSHEESPIITDDLENHCRLQQVPHVGAKLKPVIQFDGEHRVSPNVNPDLLLDGEQVDASQSLPLSTLNAASALLQIREDIEHGIGSIYVYYSHQDQALQDCTQEVLEKEAERPMALLFSCIQRFTNVVQSLVSFSRPSPQTEQALSTEIVLLILSGYLATMRLLDTLFHCMYEYICKLPPASYKSMGVKSVLRIGGIKTLQDMPFKMYAMSVLETIQTQVHNLEKYMGIPREYCLAAETSSGSTETGGGIFSSPNRSRLFRDTMSQEDLKPCWGEMSYVESIRASIKKSLVFLDN